MRILLTGGSGFIGSHLRGELERAGHDVWIIDLVRPPGDLMAAATWWHGDLLDRWDEEQSSAPLNEALAVYGPVDVVVHLAAQVGRLFGEDDLEHTVLSNPLMTALVARSCASDPAQPRLVYTSTSEIYGDLGTVLGVEDGDQLSGRLPNWRLPHNLYGLSKRWGEEAAALYTTALSASQAPGSGLQVIRPSMPYGPGLPPGRGRAAIVNMLWQAENREPIVVHRGAERSWCWVGDAVAGIRQVIEEGEVATYADQYQIGHGCYNIGRDDAGVTMRFVAMMACELTGAPPSLIEEIDAPGRQTVVKRLSTAKLEALGWEPLIDLRTGMEQTLTYMRRSGQMAAAR